MQSNGVSMLKNLEKYNFWDGNVKGMGISRAFYINQLKKLDAGKTIITVMGARRVGKSYIVRQYIKSLIEEKKINPKNILYLNLFIRDLKDLKNPNLLLETINQWEKKFDLEGKRKYIVIDEVQEINEWEKIICSLYEDYTEEYKVIITGSNANLLAGELQTYTAGRSHQITIYPLSYKEYLLFTSKEKSKQSFIDFMNDGGLPEIVLSDDLFAKNNLINSIFDTVLMRDIIQRHEIRNISILKKLIGFFCESYSDEVSINKIVTQFKSDGTKISNHTIADYLEYIKQAFFVFECQQFSYKKNDILKNMNNKYYLNDLRFALSAFGIKNLGKILENIIYLELKRNDYTVYTLRTDGKEIDFMAEKNGIRLYYQVAYTLGDENSETYNREFGNLLKIKDHYPKFVISLDDIIFSNIKGIKHINAIDFLCDDNINGII